MYYLASTFKSVCVKQRFKKKMQFKEMKKWASRCGYMVEYSQVTVTWQLLYLFHMFLVCFPLIEVTGLKKADPFWWHSVIVTSSCSPLCQSVSSEFICLKSGPHPSVKVPASSSLSFRLHLVCQANNPMGHVGMDFF